MTSRTVKNTTLVVAGFAAGILASQLSFASAADTNVDTDLSQREFIISVDEINQNFVFAERFTGSYKGAFELSDGSTRTIELTPMIHDGKHAPCVRIVVASFDLLN
jgi:hypothetical protein